MRMSTAVVVLATFLSGALLCLIAAGYMATAVEDSSETVVREALDQRGLDWAQVESDGLRVVLTGSAPDEAQRFQATSAAGEVVDSARVIDKMQTTPPEAVAPPRFSVEILRNQSGISVNGLIPVSEDREVLIERLTEIAAPAPVADLMATADHPIPEGWEQALEFTATALSLLPRSKISVDAEQIAITAIANSPEEKAELEAKLRRAAPRGLRVTLDIAAPRPVITPFTLRYRIGEDGGQFDACSADTEEARDRILAAAEAAGGTAGEACTLGLGVPSSDWAEAAEVSLAALAELGQGSVTFADADITLIATEGTTPSTFDRVVGELEAALPEVFALHPVLPPPPGEPEAGPPEFVATLSPEGQVQLRGRLNDENLQHMADSYAKARFGSASVYTAARTADGLPMDWPVRVLAGIEALSRMVNGAVTVTPDNVVVRGISSRKGTPAEVAGMLSDRLGEAQNFDLDIAYKEPPPPPEEAITPEICEAEIAEAQRITGKISFEPGSATIDDVSRDTMDTIAEILAECGDIRLEIQGHTDSQGRSSMNQQLSQDRADSVLKELRARRVLTASYTAMGYGETMPIASNDDEAGREANRRIEFRLIRPAPTREVQTTLESVAQQAVTSSEAADDAQSSETEGEDTDDE